DREPGGPQAQGRADRSPGRADPGAAVMRVVRFGPDATAAEIRALTPAPRDVEAEVRAILDEVRAGGDEAVLRLTARFDHAEVAPASLRVELAEIEAATAALDQAVAAALRKAIENVREVARAGLRESSVVTLPDGQVVELAELPLRRAGAYVPGGRAPYPSTVVMCATVAREA